MIRILNSLRVSEQYSNKYVQNSQYESVIGNVLGISDVFGHILHDPPVPISITEVKMKRAWLVVRLEILFSDTKMQGQN